MRPSRRPRSTTSIPCALALLLATACAPTAPLLLNDAPPRPGSFSLGDSAAVVRRVQQVFSCSTPANSLPYGILGWRRDSAFIDITVMQDVRPAGPNGEPSPLCWNGYRVDADGRIFALPVRSWPYTSFRKRPPDAPRL
jgi:hypothetical protein